MTRRRLTVDAAFGFGPSGSPTGTDWVALVEPGGKSRVRKADWEYGRDNEFEHFKPGTATIVLRNRDRALDPDNASSPYAGQLLPNVPVRIRSVGPAQALDLPGAGGATASTLDRASFAGSDVDVRVGLSMDDWTPGGFGEFIVSQYGGTDIAWALSMSTGGNLQFGYSMNGTAVTTDTATAATGFSDGTDHAIRINFDADNGAGGRTSTFYTSADDVTWTQLGSPVTTAGTVTLHNSSLPIAIGDVLALNGRVRWVEVRINGVLVANPNFAAQPAGSTGFEDSFGNTWAVNGTASIVHNPGVDVTFDEFYGFVQSGWIQDLAPKGRDDCTIELVDRLGLMTGNTLPDVFEDAVLGLGSTVKGFWVLDQADAEKVADLSAFRKDGSVSGEGITLGERVITLGHPPAARFDVVFDAVNGENVFGYVDFGRSPVLTGFVPSFLVVFRARSRGVVNWRTLFVQGNSNAAGHGFQLVIDTSGRLVTSFSSAALNQAKQTSGSVVDNQTHIAWASSSSGIGVDTATLTSTAGTPGLGSTNGAGIGGGRGIQVRDHMDGWIGSVALFSSLPSLANRQLVIDAYSKLNGFRSDQQIAWALDYLDVPAGMRNLDEGSVLMGPAATKGKDALQWLQSVTATEGGSLYIDHRDGGRIRFTDRYHRFLSARSVTSQATFSDDPAASNVIRYGVDGLELAPNGLDGIVNDATVTWVDGEINHKDTASIASYGARSWQWETVATTAEQARSVAEWMVVRNAQPRSRIKAVTVRATFETRNPLVDSLRLDDQVMFRIQPLKTGTATNVNLIVDRISHTASGVEWHTSFRFAQRETFTPWIWGTSQWGTDALWG